MSSRWFRLPPKSHHTPLVVVSVAQLCLLMSDTQEQLAQSDSRNDVLNLLDAACVAAAKEELRPVLSHLKLHDTLGAILLQAASTADVQVAQAALCGLWNLCGTSRGSLSSLAPLATSCVPHALKDVAHLTPEWCARVAWLMAEEPRCCEALRACDVASALRQHLQGDTKRWVQRALGRLEDGGSKKGPVSHLGSKW